VLPLRLAHQFLLDAGVPAGTLVHGLQNHDEITFQLFELGSHDDFRFEGRTYNGKQLKDRILNTLRSTVGAVPYNKLYRPQQDGITTTFAGFLAAALGIGDPYNATPDQLGLIRRAHLLAAHANAMIPGVFALAAWDLVGPLPVGVGDIPGNLTSGNDWRWINRGAVDLLGGNPGVHNSAFRLPKAKTLYGPVPEQLRDPESFASQIKRMLAARKQYRIHEATIISVPNTGNPGVILLVMTLPDNGGLAITALNYGRRAASVKVDLTRFSPSIPAASIAAQAARDVVREHDAGLVTRSGRLNIDLAELSARTLVVRRRN
jgi:maltose alpha-D-glucosyltransferase/alpha-amylase